jgi:hypothetical protein
MLASLDRRLRGEGSQAWHRGPAVRDRTGTAQPQGMLAFTAAASVLSTSATLPRLRFRFRFLFWRRWRFPFLRRKILPEAVILNRLETDFLVLARPAFLDIGAGRIRGTGPCARDFSCGKKSDALGQVAKPRSCGGMEWWRIGMIERQTGMPGEGGTFLPPLERRLVLKVNPFRCVLVSGAFLLISNALRSDG